MCGPDNRFPAGIKHCFNIETTSQRCFNGETTSKEGWNDQNVCRVITQWLNCIMLNAESHCVWGGGDTGGTIGGGGAPQHCAPAGRSADADTWRMHICAFCSEKWSFSRDPYGKLPSAAGASDLCLCIDHMYLYFIHMDLVCIRHIEFVENLHM